MLKPILNFTNFNSLLIVGKIDPERLRQELETSPADFNLLAEESIKIDEIRKLMHWLYLKPMNSLKKLAIIENAENLTNESANALLKTLEEPPSYAQIVLTTLNEQRILPTIQSRCRKIRIPLELNTDVPENYLSPQDLAGLTIKEKFDWVALVYENQANISEILTFWQVYFREKLLKGEDCLAILNQINRAKDLLETNISVKLLLENLILNF